MKTVVVLICGLAAINLVALGMYFFGKPGVPVAPSTLSWPFPQAQVQGTPGNVVPINSVTFLDSLEITDSSFVNGSVFQIEDNEPEMQRLLKERANSTSKELHALCAGFDSQASLGNLLDAARRARDARIAIYKGDRGLMQEHFKQYLQFTKDLEKHFKQRLEAGNAKADECEHCLSERLSAEIDLVRFQTDSPQ